MAESLALRLEGLGLEFGQSVIEIGHLVLESLCLVFVGLCSVCCKSSALLEVSDGLRVGFDNPAMELEVSLSRQKQRIHSIVTELVS